MNKKALFFILPVLLLNCTNREGSLFKYVNSSQSGLKFTNKITETSDLNILDYLYFYNGGGVAIGDINQDGLPDIFLSANQEPNKLFLNQGSLKFKDITEEAGVSGNSDWNTGAIMADINGDGLLDIYVTAVVGINGFDGHNELFINQGNNTFSEQSVQYGLDFDTYSSSAAVLDYDLDGDLDIFLLNHAVHTQKSFGNASLRNERNYETGDRLLRNDGSKFTDVSIEAGIFGGINGYGLGVAVADFNQDGWPDIYVGNDFHEDDYYYLNQKDGTFKESMKEYFGHISRFSMGNDVADINFDGLPDLLSLDMLPEDEVVLKSSEGDDNVQTLKMRTEGYGYHYQYTRNMLFVNQKQSKFMETALMSGVAATDWSWSALIEDYNQDGVQDIFISNGIPKRPNDLDFIRFVSSEQIQNKINETKLVDKEALDLMPSGRVHNYVFEGGKKLRFIDRSGEWIKKDSLVSGATAFGDLDGDGDLDLVINNLNEEVSLIENKTNEQANYLKIKFDYKAKNKYGIGTKVFSYHNGIQQFKELYPVRGFQASSEPIVHFGYDNQNLVDSLKVIWPDGSYQLLTDINTNQELVIRPENTKPYQHPSTKPEKSLFQTTEALGIDYEHREDPYLDFNRQKLIPFQVSTRGPALAIGDLNEDMKPDLFFGGSKFSPSRIYYQDDSGFKEQSLVAIANDSVKEDVSAVIADFDGDMINDLFVASGGADFYGQQPPLLDSYYLFGNEAVQAKSVEGLFENAAIVIAEDFDQDGDIDLFVGNNMVTNDYGQIPESYVLLNKNGSFSKQENEALNSVGMVTSALWSDFNEDGWTDLIIVGEWMSPTFFKNEEGVLKTYQAIDEPMNGLWQSVIDFDIDNDGDLDYILGNWGGNSKFKASQKWPLRMYYGDFDANGQSETIVANAYQGAYYPLAGLDELGSQMVSLRKKFPNYRDFAGKTITEILSPEALKSAELFEVEMLRSGMLRNENGRFKFEPFNIELQSAPITAMTKFDFDNDAQQEVLLAGNFFGVTPYHGRFDSFPGALLDQDGKTTLGHEIGLDLMHRSARHLSTIEFKGKPYLLVTFNNDKVQLYSLLNFDD